MVAGSGARDGGARARVVAARGRRRAGRSAVAKYPWGVYSWTRRDAGGAAVPRPWEHPRSGFRYPCEEYGMKAPTTPVLLGGYALILLVVLAAGFGIGRATGAPAPPVPPAPHSSAHTPHPYAHHEEQS